MPFENLKILIIGGTGSLGNELTKRNLENNQVYLYSRDESKHWSMEIDYGNHPNLHFIIGNISDRDKVRQTLIRHNFDLIILAAALKHIDKCEYEINECLNTNLLGTKFVLDEIESNLKDLTRLKTVCFVSTDKACHPVNAYGMSKALSECLMIEKARYIDRVKFVCVRYGNVLNSRGSIIPMLHRIGQNSGIPHFKLTDPRMTRFVMTLEQSVDLIEHAVIHGSSGDIVIPRLVSCQISDMLEIFSEIYDKPVVLGQMRPGEKLLECLVNETQSLRLEAGTDGYSYIKPAHKNVSLSSSVQEYNSVINPLGKEELREFLKGLKLI
jgi:UDP-glucose 4-epimerase